LKEKVAAPVYKTDNTAVRIRCADYVAKKLALTSPTNGDRWVGTVLSRTQATEFSLETLASVVLFLLQEGSVSSVVIGSLTFIRNRIRFPLISTRQIFTEVFIVLYYKHGLLLVGFI
jgi:hypothetical protein